MSSVRIDSTISASSAAKRARCTTGVGREHRRQGGIGRECPPVEVVGKGVEVDEAERLLDSGDLGGRHVITVMEGTPPRLSNRCSTASGTAEDEQPVLRTGTGRRAHRLPMETNSAPSTVALITGGGRGIGRMVAVDLARAGVAVGVIARSESELAETATLVFGAGGVGWAAMADVTDASDLRKAIG